MIKYTKQELSRKRREQAELAAFLKAHPLPKGVKTVDLKYPSHREKRVYDEDFELWFITGFGWVIPTLFIRAAGRRAAAGSSHRTYAVRVDNGGGCRVGIGPHVLRRLRVYVRKVRQAALAPLIALHHQGEVQANQSRDRISTRRMRNTYRNDDVGAVTRLLRGF